MPFGVNIVIFHFLPIIESIYWGTCMVMAFYLAELFCGSSQCLRYFMHRSKYTCIKCQDESFRFIAVSCWHCDVRGNCVSQTSSHLPQCPYPAQSPLNAE